jgi:hypothetical protein
VVKVSTTLTFFSSVGKLELTRRGLQVAHEQFSGTTTICEHSPFGTSNGSLLPRVAVLLEPRKDRYIDNMTPNLYLAGSARIRFVTCMMIYFAQGIAGGLLAIAMPA